MNDELEVKETQESALAPAANIQSLEKTVQQAEKYIEVLQRIRGASLKLTNTRDWTNEGGNPYLQKSGCDKIASAFGVRITETTFEKENITDDKGEYVIYTCTSTGAWNNNIATESGTGSTRDAFFGRKGGKDLPLSEIDLTDIKKKALTNCMNRLIKRLLGLSFTWEEIGELTANKITPANVQKIEYGQGNKGGNVDSPETKKLRQEVGKMLMDLNDGEAGAASKMLEVMTTFKGRDGNMVKGKLKLEHLSEKQVPILHGQLEKKISEMNKELDTQAAKENEAPNA